VRVASFFAGIGGFDLGFQRAGHEIVFQCEIDEFCFQTLSYHWPEVKREKDVRTIISTTVPTAEIWCGGFPCQDVSLARARTREGLKGKNTGLFYPFAELLGQALPPIFVLENVPGLLSSHGGRDFAIVLQTLAKFGYAVAWRVLNSQYFGLPQSRSRLYIVGYYRDPKRAGEILFEPECGSRNVEACKQTRKKSLSAFKESLGDHGKGPIVQRISYCLAATSGRHTGTDWSRSYVCYPKAVRRFTPEETERLQGFPTGWTLPPSLKGISKQEIDSPRYAALGNAVSVPVAEWIGQRIGLVAEEFAAQKNLIDNLPVEVGSSL